MPSKISFAVDTAGSKSQIAIEYCYRFRRAHSTSHVFWVYCATADRFRQGYQNIARKLNSTGWDDPKLDVLQIVREWLEDENHERWLMILDNADDGHIFFPPSQPACGEAQVVPLVKYMPRSLNGFVLITTRDNRVGRDLTGRESLPIMPFDQLQARHLLRLKLPDAQPIEEEIAELMRELGFLPLAITQAAAFISRNGISVKEYLGLLKQDDAELAALLAQDIPDLRRDFQASSSVLQTWKLSFDHIQRQCPRAAQMLCLMAFFERQAVPKFLLQSEGESKTEFITARGVLQAFFLISIASGGELLSLHRLVQLFTITWLEFRNEKAFYQELALKILTLEYPDGRYESWPICELLAPHA